MDRVFEARSHRRPKRGQVKTYVTRYKSPERRKLVEHDDDDCPACQMLSPTSPDGSILYVELESEDGAHKAIRRVVKSTAGAGVYVSSTEVMAVAKDSPIMRCTLVTAEEVDAEIERIRRKPGAVVHDDAKEPESDSFAQLAKNLPEPTPTEQ